MVEIERKFLVNKEKWKPGEEVIEIKQGYLSVDPLRVVRVRTAGNDAFITIKGKAKGIVRTELEYSIPKPEADVLLKMCLDIPIEKKRFIENVGNRMWEIDVFEGENKGLVLAEIELSDENESFELPDWAEEEVSHDRRYFNSWLSKNPFSKW